VQTQAARLSKRTTTDIAKNYATHVVRLEDSRKETLTRRKSHACRQTASLESRARAHAMLSCIKMHSECERSFTRDAASKVEHCSISSEIHARSRKAASDVYCSCSSKSSGVRHARKGAKVNGQFHQPACPSFQRSRLHWWSSVHAEASISRQ
jgi:hypothetical protein